MIETLKLEITQEDINKAFENFKNRSIRTKTCPISQSAIRNNIKGFVGSAGGNIVTEERTWSGGQPALLFMNNFDKGRKVIPCTLIFGREI